jgi:hypothetical protein
VVRGIATINSPAPGRVRGIETEPLQRMALLVGVSPGSPAAERIAADVKTFRELKFPVTEVKRAATQDGLTMDELALIGRWVDTLDRL